MIEINDSMHYVIQEIMIIIKSRFSLLHHSPPVCSYMNDDRCFEKRSEHVDRIEWFEEVWWLKLQLVV